MKKQFIRMISLPLISAVILFLTACTVGTNNSSKSSSSSTGMSGINVDLKMKVAATAPNLKLKASMKGYPFFWTQTNQGTENAACIFLTFLDYNPTNMPFMVDDANVYAVIISSSSLVLRHTITTIPDQYQQQCRCVLGGIRGRTRATWAASHIRQGHITMPLTLRSTPLGR